MKIKILNEKDKNIIEIINYINNNINDDNNNNISNINSGIGDILLTKIYVNPEYINYNIKHLIDYKPYPDNLKSIKFNIQLLYKLFDKEKINIFYNNSLRIKSCLNFKKYNCNYDLSKYFKNLNIYNYEYIVIHTKLRFRKGEGFLVNYTKKFLNNFF